MKTLKFPYVLISHLFGLISKFLIDDNRNVSNRVFYVFFKLFALGGVDIQNKKKAENDC